MRIPALAILTAAMFGALLPRLSAAPPPVVHIQYRLFPHLAAMDGNWNALSVGPDGRVYIGLAHHGGNGRAMVYNPRTGRMRDIGNLTELCGEAGLGLGPQSKVHAKFGFPQSGLVYFATHAGWWWNFARFDTPRGYPGGHWMIYNPRTHAVTNLGIGLRNDGIITDVYDPIYHRTYAITYPRAHFIYYDYRTHQTTDLGRVNNWDSVLRTLGLDDRGNVYGSFGAGQIFKYDPRTNRLTELPVYLPHLPKGVNLGRDYTMSEDEWREIVWDAVTRRFFGIESSGSYLFSFNPRAGRHGKVTTLGQMLIPGRDNPRTIPAATLAFTLGKNRKLYYVAPWREFGYFAKRSPGTAHLLTYDIQTRKFQDLGPMRLPDSRGVMGAESAATGVHGTIYFVGAIPVPDIPGKFAHEIGHTPMRLALLMYHPRHPVTP
ncbi:MAG: hypothetical protein M1588_04155 [Planctomycetes bacterium]|nr:hypothetical protein [Planctomycetota bacterium]